MIMPRIRSFRFYSIVMVMLWIGFAVVAAITLGVTEYLTKRAYNNFDAWTLSWARNIFALPVFYILLAWDGMPIVDDNFWKLLLLAAPLELIIGITFFLSIKLTPLSLVLPFTTLSTIFIAVGSYFINNDPLKPVYVVAFPLILLGAYFIQEKRTLNLKVLKNSKSELGIALMILTTALFGLAIPIGRVMSEASSSFFYLAVNFTVFILLFTPIFLKLKNTNAKQIYKKRNMLVTIGLFNGIFLCSLWLAFTNGPAGPVSAINNMSILIAVILAGTLLKEIGIFRRLMATAIMIFGASLAVLG